MTFGGYKQKSEWDELVASRKSKSKSVPPRGINAHAPREKNLYLSNFWCPRNEIWFGTVEDNLTKDVIFKGRPGRLCSIPFLGGGA